MGKLIESSWSFFICFYFSICLDADGGPSDEYHVFMEK